MSATKAGVTPIFAASEMAAALGWTKRRVQTALETVRPSGMKAVVGIPAHAWALALLPAALAEQLEKIRLVHHYRTTADVLHNPVKPWQPPIPLSRLVDADLTKAAQLQRALARALALPEETTTSERARVAGPDFAREMGYAVSDRQLRALLTRTLDRDRRAFAWHRLELYLPDNLKAKDAPRPRVTTTPRLLFPELDEALSTITNRAAPTATEIAFCWRKVIECFADRAGADTDEQKLKSDLRAYLLTAAPFLAESPQALKRNFNRKLSAAEESGLAALVDQRPEKSGHRRAVPEWEENISLLAKWTRARGGRESQAWRELHLGKTPSGERFSEGFRACFAFDVRRDKSAVPARVRDALRPMIAATDDVALGPRQARLRLPSIRRDWSDTAAGDYYTSDDVTVNHYWYEWAEFGEYEFDGRRFNVGRGQWLPVVDERTDNPLSFLLLPNRSYSAWAIMRLNTRTFSDERIGLPFRGMKYEQGIWKARALASQFSWAAIDEGFTRQGVSLQLRHATTPKAKIIERVIGSAQNLMEHLPGYVGRDEMHVRFERIHQFLARLKRVGQPLKGEVNPAEMLLNKEQFSDELMKVMRAFAEEPQNGERLAGLSPAEAWKQLAPNRPHIVLPPSLAYLLSAARSEQTVTSDGVKVEVAGQCHYYCGSEQLGALRGEKVLVYFNPDLPEQVVVVHPKSDPRGVNAFAVPLFQRLPANTATKEQFAEASKHRKAFAKYGQATFRAIAPAHNLTVRNEALGNPDLRAFGERHRGLEREHIHLSAAREDNRREIGDLAARLGADIDPAKSRRPERVAKSLRTAIDLEAQLRAEEAAEDTAGGETSSAPSFTNAATLAAPTTATVTAQDIRVYWALWKKVKTAAPDADRHALTRRVLGYLKPHKELTRAEWAKLISAFTTIAKPKQP